MKQRPRILFLSYVLQVGHINFEQIQIDALRAQGFDVDLALPAYEAKHLPYPETDYTCILPQKITQNTPSPLRNRLNFVKTLIYLKQHIDWSKYDAAVVSTLDELTLALVPLPIKMFLFCHANAAQAQKGIKAWCLRKLGRRHSFLVFNENMATPLRSIAKEPVFVVRHGCLPPFETHADVPLPIPIPEKGKIIFHPSPHPAPHFLQAVAQDKKLQTYLQAHDWHLVLRHASEAAASCTNIYSIDHFLPTDAYRRLFMAANTILLAYPSDFRHRVSGVSFEALANRKRLLYADIPALQYCNMYYNYTPAFTSTHELMERLQAFDAQPDLGCISKREDLQPDYSSVKHAILEHVSAKRTKQK